MKRKEMNREEMIFSPLLLSCRTPLLIKTGAAFALLNVKFSKLRTAHYRPNVPRGAIILVQHPLGPEHMLWSEARRSTQGRFQ
jgi:hypothetical protein